MSDPPNVVVKSKNVTIAESDDGEIRPAVSTPQRQRSLNRSTSRNSESDNGGTSQFQRPSSRKKRSTRRSDANAESIVLQETAPRNQAATLKASFLRRKIKEYEGNPIKSR